MRVCGARLRSGSMDMKEVASVLKKLKDIAKAALERGGRGKERAASLQVVAERFETAARDTDAYETADRETNENRASQKAGPRLGALLKTRNMKNATTTLLYYFNKFNSNLLSDIT